jgi:hypothetical protein
MKLQTTDIMYRPPGERHFRSIGTFGGGALMFTTYDNVASVHRLNQFDWISSAYVFIAREVMR